MATETVRVCPHCERPNRWQRRQWVIESGDGRGAPKEYYCYGCNRAFKEPKDRLPDGPTNTRAGTLAGELADMDPDELTG